MCHCILSCFKMPLHMQERWNSYYFIRKLNWPWEKAITLAHLLSMFISQMLYFVPVVMYTKINPLKWKYYKVSSIGQKVRSLAFYSLVHIIIIIEKLHSGLRGFSNHPTRQQCPLWRFVSTILVALFKFGRANASCGYLTRYSWCLISCDIIYSVLGRRIKWVYKPVKHFS